MRAVLTFCAAVAAGLLHVPSARAQAPGSEPILLCHSFARAPYLCDAIGACNRNLKLARIRMDIASRCIDRWLGCDLLSRTGSPSADSCPPSAGARCARGEATAEAWITQAAPEQRQRVVDRCAPLDFQDEFLTGPPLGLGFGASASTCSGFGVPLPDIPSYTVCGDIYQTWLHARLLSLVFPRSRELLEDNGWCSLLSEEGVTPPVCNSGLAPRPVVAGVPTARVSNVDRCQKRLYQSFRKVLTRDLNFLEYCTEEYLNCNMKEAYGDITPNALEGCIDRASHTCTRTRETRDRRVPRLIEEIKRACNGLTFQDLTDVLGFGDVAAGCNAGTIDELVDCVRDQIRCLAWEIVRFVEPRIAEDSPPEFLVDYAACGS
jgi:hypothetical protein